MSQTEKLYLAAMGMLSPLGDSPEFTAASVTAGISAYQASDYENRHGEFVTMTGVPDKTYEDFDIEIDEGVEYCELYDRIIKMAILAAEQVFQRHPVSKPVPLILSLAENRPYDLNINPELLLDNLINQAELPIDPQQVRTVHTGRAAVIHSLDLAQGFLNGSQNDYVLVGASDSHWDSTVIALLDKAGRALAPGEKNAFAPGEGACFLLLTRQPEKALQIDGHLISLSNPGTAEEAGHLNSKEPYLGEGLHQAFQQALNNHQGDKIHSIYSSMNGEHHWAKEYGVATSRNQQHLADNLIHQHPADCLGDLGAASGAVLIALAVENLKKLPGPTCHLVYTSSDGPWRSALKVIKEALTPTNSHTFHQPKEVQSL